jgi:hypothetical protein
VVKMELISDMPQAMHGHWKLRAKPNNRLIRGIWWVAVVDTGRAHPPSSAAENRPLQ